MEVTSMNLGKFQKGYTSSPYAVICLCSSLFTLKVYLYILGLKSSLYNALLCIFPVSP